VDRKPNGLRRPERSPPPGTAKINTVTATGSITAALGQRRSISAGQAGRGRRRLVTGY